ncbi:hypothetical protein M426DRAFT_325221 [Hypoxylon sp. CI-4A]|nr:hypothetical protein M426DRAFT_325221 [Hypoxylon sp. CI-4A]
MTSSPPPIRQFDPSRPFDGLVLCCTSIEADLRTEIAQQTTNLGGVHKYDLTPDVTHLIVGDYDTAKYRHVARERPDIKPMAAGWVEAVRELWVDDAEYDFDTLESTWRLKTFETGGGIPKSPIEEQRQRTRLVCCLTGFEDNETRVMIEEKVRTNGGDYIGDLSRRVTHLIVCKPEGKKYVAARRWGIRTVSVEWLHDSVKRGMVLNEESYDPTLPVEERGKGAWIRRELQKVASLGKRSRDGSAVPLADEGRRKLRKTASMKLTSQKDNLWGDILVNRSSTDLSRPEAKAAKERPASVPPNPPVAHSITSVVETPQLPQPNGHIQQVGSGVFSSCRFYVHGFPRNKREVVHNHILSHDGRISHSLEDLASANEEPSDRRYLIVPQASQPDTHPQLPGGIQIITEFYIERCVHSKTLLEPTDHVLGQPFPRFPIEDFHKLTICTAGFRNEQLNQVEKAIIQLGARYSERLNAQCSLLVCPSVASVRKQKLDFAVVSKVPVVGAEWLWQCVTTGCFVPWDDFLFKELAPESRGERDAPGREVKDKITRPRPDASSRGEPGSKPPDAAVRQDIDMTAFDNGPLLPRDAADQVQETEDTTFETAPTRQANSIDADPPSAAAPLAEKTSNSLNKTPSPHKTVTEARKLKRFPTGGEVDDSESDKDLSASANRQDRDTSMKEAEEQKRRAEGTRVAMQREMSERLKSLVSLDGAAQDGDNPKLQSAPKQQRRRREILGRAASNVSTASSASAESSAHMSSSKSHSRRPDSITTNVSTDRSVSLEKIVDHEGNDTMMNNGEDPPRPTQFGYDNSEAQRHRDVVIGRLNEAGGKQSEGDLTSSEKIRTKPSSSKAANGSGGLAQRSSTRRGARR